MSMELVVITNRDNLTNGRIDVRVVQPANLRAQKDLDEWLLAFTQKFTIEPRKGEHLVIVGVVMERRLVSVVGLCCSDCVRGHCSILTRRLKEMVGAAGHPFVPEYVTPAMEQIAQSCKRFVKKEKVSG